MVAYRKAANTAPEKHTEVGQPIVLRNCAWNIARNGLNIESSKQGI